MSRMARSVASARALRLGGMFPLVPTARRRPGTVVDDREQTSKTRAAAVARIAMMWTKRNKATRWLWALAALGLVAGVCGGDGDAETSGGREAVVDPYEGHTSITYHGT